MFKYVGPMVAEYGYLDVKITHNVRSCRKLLKKVLDVLGD